jgi:hypothetical protein
MERVSDERLEQLLNEATVLARQAAVDVQRCATVSARQVNQSRLDHHECVASIYRELRERREAERKLTDGMAAATVADEAFLAANRPAAPEVKP